MGLIKVDYEKCIRCGACSDVCPSQIIETNDEGLPIKGKDRSCIACGHCTAVCPVAAMDNRKAMLADCEQLGDWELPDAETMRKILRSRRSIRCYKSQNIHESKITELLDLARYAPTGGNSQGLSFVVFSDRKLLHELSQSVIDWMQHQIDNKIEDYIYFRGAVKAWNDHGYDCILRGAPHLIVAIAPQKDKRAMSNCSYVWSYAELFAPSMGLGTCIAGYMHAAAFLQWQPLLSLLELPEGFAPAGFLMAGYPKYKYKRLPPRQPLNVYIR